MLGGACRGANHIGDTDPHRAALMMAPFAWIRHPSHPCEAPLHNARLFAESPPMETPRLRVGRAITPEQFELLADEQLVRLLPRAVREFFPGKDFCADGSFYVHDGTAWSFFKGGFVDE